MLEFGGLMIIIIIITIIIIIIIIDSLAREVYIDTSPLTLS